MAGERRHVRWVGLEVVDDALYARYRAEMTPILASHGGAFAHDFAVAKVLASSAGPRINRVFALSFPDGAAQERFFADERYRSVRAAYFEPAVGVRAELGSEAVSEVR